MLSFITPPAALAAGSIAGVDPMSAGFKAMRLGSVLFLLPCVFVLNPELILEGSLAGCLIATATATVGIMLISFALEVWAYWVGRLGLAARAGLLVAAVLLVIPGAVSDLYGAVLAAVILGLKALSNRLSVRRVQ